MALTDLKSDLSKFRKPIERPPIENQSVEVNRKSNLTPISDLSNRITSPTPLKETPVKSVVIPKLFDNTEKFKGETEPKPMTLERKFLGETDPNKMSLESKFLGQTTPSNFDFSPEFTTPKLGSVDFFPNTNADGFTTKMEESRFNFSSLSSPTPMTLEGKFLGETDPNRLSLESKFLGQTTPTPIDNTEKFKGQTTPNEVDDTEKFKGQTTPTNFTFIPQFTATTPTNFTFTPQFTATTPTNFTFTPQFTTPNLSNVDFIPNIDAKGFTSKMKQVPSQFVDINRDQSIFTERTLNSKLGLVNFFSNEDAVGFTKNFNPGSKSQFRGIDILSNEFTSNKITTQLGITNWFGDDDSKGFTKNFVDKTKSQFTGISGETFTSPKVKFDRDFGLSFVPGNKIKLEGSARKYYERGSQKWQPGGERYEDKYVSIGDLLIRENSPSYLTKVYGEFNLKDDSFNPYPLLFRQPFILRGIQRKNNKEPQKWGFGLSIDSIMGVDLIRGGVVTSTERALVDVARIGQFILSPKGLVWSVMQVGMQRTNRYNKVWTPINLLAAVGGQHIGLKPKRHGLLPFGPDNGNYENFATTGYKTKLQELLQEMIIAYNVRKAGLETFLTLEDKKGGPDSVYGIGNTTYTRSTSKLIKVPGVENFDTFGKNKPRLITDNNEFLNYNEIGEFSKKLGEKKTKYNDFRSKYKDKPLPGKKSLLDDKIRDYKDNPDGKYYEQFNIEKKFGFANSDTTIGKSYSTKIVEGNANQKKEDYDDLIPLIFQTYNTRVQFRGTVNSISETFTPNWTEIKYSGRAENAYLYDTFTRELNFGFRVYAYSVGELQPMWERLENLARMTMPTYIDNKGYRGNITKFTLGTMYKNFPALISSLQYAVPDEFTWEIGYNQGSASNKLPMGVDVTIGLKLLNKTLHSADSKTKIYDFKRFNPGAAGGTIEDLNEFGSGDKDKLLKMSK